MSEPSPLDARRSDASPTSDYRSPFRKDRDRIFYAAEFGRLEGVTQVLTVLSTTIHNRLTHSYRVEQVARSIAAKLISEGHGNLVDEDVVMAASLGHDIGHSPFGHTGEDALQRAVMCGYHYAAKNSTDWQGREPLRPAKDRRELVCDECDLIDGFEGNAQSLRVLARLAAKAGPEGFGLDLTRRALAAAAKYPWSKGGNTKKPAKWGAYDCDLDILRWVNGVGEKDSPDMESVPLEAQIMDAADDIAYAVHDLEDFYKIGVVPLHEIRIDRAKQTSRLLDYIRNEKVGINYDPLQDLVEEYTRYVVDGLPTATDDDEDEDEDERQREEAASAIDPATYPVLAEVKRLMSYFPKDRYVDDLQGRAGLTRFRSDMIALFITDLEVDSAGNLEYKTPAVRIFVEFLKQLAWYYVIDDPQLTAIRTGQERIVTDCFEELKTQASNLWVGQDPQTEAQILLEPTPHEVRSLPRRLVDYVRIGVNAPGRYFPSEIVARAVVDYICSLTDEELYGLASQLRGLPTHSAPGLRLT